MRVASFVFLRGEEGERMGEEARGSERREEERNVRNERNDRDDRNERNEGDVRN